MYTLLLLATMLLAIMVLGAVITPTTFGTEMKFMPPQTTSYTPVPPQVHYGRSRRSWFTYVLAGNEVQNTAIFGLAIVPKNARIAKSFICCSAGPGAAVTFDIGLAARDGSGVIDANTALETESTTYDGLPAPTSLADTGNLLGNFAPANAAATGAFADTFANKVGMVVRKDAILIATVKAANVTAVATLFGYIDYTVD